MKIANRTFCKLVLVFAALVPSVVSADIFGTGLNQFEIEFTTIGNAGNTADSDPFLSGLGTVNYVYGIGTYEISRSMVEKANNLGGLGLTLAPMSGVTGGPRPGMAASGLDWHETARFVNWLNTSTGNAPAYKFNGTTFALWQAGDAGYDPNNLFRNSQARYFLPSENEWYKAAYYDAATDSYSRFATGSDVVPASVTSGIAANTAVYNLSGSQGPADIMLAGGRSFYGTMGQSGNLFELLETEHDRVNNNVHPNATKVIRGGDWTTTDIDYISRTISGGLTSSSSQNWVGFRVATNFSSVPEPASGLLLGGCVVWVAIFRRNRQNN
jgi:hypothetical protein